MIKVTMDLIKLDITDIVNNKIYDSCRLNRFLSFIHFKNNLHLTIDSVQRYIMLNRHVSAGDIIISMDLLWTILLNENNIITTEHIYYINNLGN